MFPDRLSQIRKFGFAEMTARVARIGSDKLNRHLVVCADARRCSIGLGWLVHFADQRCKSTSKAFSGKIVAHVTSAYSG